MGVRVVPLDRKPAYHHGDMTATSSNVSPINANVTDYLLSAVIALTAPRHIYRKQRPQRKRMSSQWENVAIYQLRHIPLRAP